MNGGKNKNADLLAPSMRYHTEHHRFDGRQSVGAVDDYQFIGLQGAEAMVVNAPGFLRYSFSNPWFVNFKVRLFSVTVRTT
jgi:hypothetical protein